MKVNITKDLWPRSFITYCMQEFCSTFSPSYCQCVEQTFLCVPFISQVHLWQPVRPLYQPPLDLVVKNWCFFLHISDQRVRGWLLLDNYPPTFALTVMYLLIVWMGPKYMKHRQPYSCRGLLVVYNLGLTLLSFYMFYEVNRLWGAARCGKVGQSNRCSALLQRDYKGRWNQPEPELHTH